LKALELATWVPNGGNKQPWRFWIVSNKEMIRKIADEMNTRTQLIASWPESAPFGETVSRWQRNSDFFRGAPVLIAACTGKYASIADKMMQERGDDPVAKEMRSNRDAARTALQSLASVASLFCLLLHHCGVGTTYMTGPVQAKKEIEGILQIPQEWDFVAMIAAGYPDEVPGVSQRKPVQEVVQFCR
jgi:nitroreductase